MTNLHPAFTQDMLQNYDQYLGPLIFREYAEDISRRCSVRSNGVVLETAAGTGLATRQLRDNLDDDVSLMVTDINENMLNIAKAKFKSNEKIIFEVADALGLPFAGESFDAVVCQFSMMFFSNKLAAMQEVVRILKPSGEFLFNVWDSYEHNYLIRTVNKILVESMPEDPPKFFNIPYGYYEIDVIKELLIKAGFCDIEISVLPRFSQAVDARQVALAYVLGSPVRLHIEKIAPELLTNIVDLVEEAVGKEFGYQSISAKMQAIVFKACLPN